MRENIWQSIARELDGVYDSFTFTEISILKSYYVFYIFISCILRASVATGVKGSVAAKIIFFIVGQIVSCPVYGDLKS